LRRELHSRPETSGQEHATTRFIMDFLAERGLKSEVTTFGTGCVCTFGEGPDTLLLRADIDALPVEEETGAPFASAKKGVMHACGHDVHTAILLAVADTLCSGEVEFEGRLILLFQPAEEGKGGCRSLVEQGLLERFHPRRAVALHVWPGLASNCVALVPGPFMAGVNHLKVEFTASGGHGALPHGVPDTIAAAAHFVTTVQALLTRKLDARKRGLLTFGMFHGGSAPNIIPPKVSLEGTMRWFEEEAKDEIAETVSHSASLCAALYGAEASVQIDEGYVPTVNSPQAAKELEVGLRGVLGGERVKKAEISMGSEDMGFILSRVEGVYLEVGAGSTGPGAQALHCPRFLPEEECLETGFAAMLTAVRTFARLP